MPVEGLRYTLTARHSGLLLDILGRNTGELAQVSQWEDQKEAGVQQKWIFERVSDGVYRVKSSLSGRYLAAELIPFPGYGGTGRYIGTTAVDNAGSHLWGLEDAGDGYFRLQSRAPQVLRDYAPVYLDVIGEDRRNEAQLGLCSETLPGYQQMWKLTRIDPLPTLEHGTPVGRRAQLCGPGRQQCKLTLPSTTTTGGSTTQTDERTVTDTLEIAISGGVQFEGFSSEVSASNQHSVAVTEALQIARSKEYAQSRTDNICISYRNYDVNSVWTWVVETPISGDNVTIQTIQHACSPDGNPPRYLPGSQEHIDNACLVEKPGVTVPPVSCQ